MSIGLARIDIEADASGFGATASDEVTKALQGVAKDAASIFSSIESDAASMFEGINRGAETSGDRTSRSLAEVMAEVDAMTSAAAADAAEAFDKIPEAARSSGDRTKKSYKSDMDEVEAAARKAAEEAAREMDQSSRQSESYWSRFARSVSAEVSSLGDSFRTLGSKASGWAQTHKAEAGIALGALGGLAYATVDYASQAEQSYGAVESIFGAHADKIVASSKRAADAVGLSGNEYRELATVTGAMLKNMGMPMDEVTAKTQDLVGVGADLAATYGGTTKDAMEAISSLLRGETDPIERYGVSIREADISARLAAEGLDGLEGAAAKQARGQVLLTMLTEQAGGALGQFAREADTAAGKQERARARMQDAREEIGNNLLPVYASLMDIGGKVAGVIGKHPQVFLAVAGAIATFAGGVLILGTVAPIFTALSVAATAAGTSMWGFVAAQAAAFAPVLAVVAGIGLLVGAFVLLWNKSETFRDFWIGLWEGIKGTVVGVVETVREVWDGLVGAFTGDGAAGGDALAKFVGVDKANTIVDVIQTVKDVLLEIPEAAQRIYDILFKGDFTGGFFGIEEDSPVVAALLTVRDVALSAWGMIKDAGAGIASAGWDVLVAIFDSVVAVGEALFGALVEIGSAVWDLIKVLAPILLPVLKVIGAVIGGVLVGAFFLLMGALKVVAGVFSAFAAVITWVSENVLSPLIGIIGVVVGWLIDRLGGAISWLAEKIPAAFEWIKSAAGSFRDGLVSAFEWISEAAGNVWKFMQAAWDTVGRPVFDGIVTAGKYLAAILGTLVFAPILIAWNLMSAGFRWSWETLIKPAWDAISAGATWLYENVLSPVFGWIGDKWEAISLRIQAGWYVIQAIWALVVFKAQELYNTYIAPIFDSIGAAWEWVSFRIEAGWYKIQAIWALLVFKVQELYNTYIAPIFNSISAAWDVVSFRIEAGWYKIQALWALMGFKIQELYNKYIAPIIESISSKWEWMTGKLTDGYNWVKEKVFDALSSGLDGVRSSFQVAVDAIAKIWEGIKRAAGAPARFVIDTVWNGGVLKAWNAVAGLVGLDTQDDIKHDLGGFASGGVLSGWSPGKDDRVFYSPSTGEKVAMAGGEAIMVPQFTKAVGGKAGVEELNRAALRGDPMGFAKGGVMPPMRGSERGLQTNAIRAGRAISMKFPEVQTIGGYRPVDPYPDHPSGRALDVMVGGLKLGDAVKDYLFANNSVFKMQYALWKQAQWNTASSAKPMADRGSPTQNHMDHVHAYFTPSPYPTPGFDYGPVPEGAGTAVFGEGGGGFFESVASVVKRIWDGIIGSVGEWTEGGGTVAKLPGAFLKKAGGMAWDFVSEKASALGSFFGGGGDGGAGVAQWRPLVEKILGAKGLDLGLADTTLRRMNQESGGNPRAINNWDSNAAAGIPSKGLMQVIDPTFRAHADPGFNADIWDPESNIRASMNYALRRYGSLPAAYDRAGGYHEGGLMGEGDGFFHKTAIEPEMVLSPEQTAAFVDWMRMGSPDSSDAADKFAGQVVDLLGAGGVRAYPVSNDQGGSGGRTRIVQVTQNIYGTDSASESAGRIIDLLDRL